MSEKGVIEERDEERGFGQRRDQACCAQIWVERRDLLLQLWNRPYSHSLQTRDLGRMRDEPVRVGSAAKEHGRQKWD